MKMVLIASACILNLLLFGCTIRYTANPILIQKVDRKEICVIEDEADGRFLLSYKKALEEKGFSVKILSFESDVAACPLSSMYKSVWSWDLVVYMPRAQIFVFRNGILTGNALYDSSGLALTKYERTHKKITNMVDLLFPDTEKLDKK